MTHAFLNNCDSMEPVLQEYSYRYLGHCLSEVYTFRPGVVEMNVLVGPTTISSFLGACFRVLGDFVEPESSKVIGNYVRLRSL
ncbi:unnamed protein product [Arabidopsis halleri]